MKIDQAAGILKLAKYQKDSLDSRWELFMCHIQPVIPWSADAGEAVLCQGWL